MKLTFKMTGEEFYHGFRYKVNKTGMGETAQIAVIIAIIIAFTVFTVLKLIDFYLSIFVVLLAIFYAVQMITNKKSVIRDYEISPILNDEHTINIYDEGIELINSYEKIYAPWQSVFSFKETSKELIILPTLSRGVAVINKERYAGNELQNLINVLKSKGVKRWVLPLTIFWTGRI